MPRSTPRAAPHAQEFNCSAVFNAYPKTMASAYMRHAIPALTYLIVTAGCLHPLSASAADRLQWTCEQRYDTLFHVDCSIERQKVPAERADTPREVPDALPMSNRYLAVAQRPTEEIHAYQIWRVPLYGVPIDRTNAEFLLQSVLCGRIRECSVRYDLGQREPVARISHPFIR